MAKKTTQIYAEDRITEKLAAELPGWKLINGWIRRTYKTGGWPHTLMLVNAIGYIAEAAWHHPDLEVSWAQVEVKLMTHSAKGITDNDFELARRIEEQAVWLPADDCPLDGFENGFKKKWTR